MRPLLAICPAFLLAAGPLWAADPPPAFIADPQQSLERTCFQTHAAWRGDCNLRSDVAIVYGFNSTLAQRIQSWRDHGYRVHLMTGVAWGDYSDYLLGKFDGHNHEDEEQTDRNGHAHEHGNGVFYICPGTNYGNYLCAGVRRALEAGVEAVHLEEPEFWVQDGYSAGFKREWLHFYGEPWQPPHSSLDAQWRASHLKYFLYRRTLQQVFDSVQEFNRQTGRHVRCYVPTHSLLNYATWGIVSPESSLARLDGCDGYIAQVWTGTARTPNVFRGQQRERTFETAFLEFGAMQNLARATDRRVWFLNDPIEDNPDHDWTDYRRNWECTLTASLFQPEVWRFEVAPWPERVFGQRYPRSAPAERRQPMPPAYATAFQTVINALNDLDQKEVAWDCGTAGIGVVVSDSLMFERGDPAPSDPGLGHIYGLALPFLKRGMPVQPAQLEDFGIPGYLDGFRCLLLTYRGMKPLSPGVHKPLADWVKRGGVLVVCDDDRDPFNAVREWWNTNGPHYATPRQHLFEQLRLARDDPQPLRAGRGQVLWMHRNPADIAASPDAANQLLGLVREAAERSAAAPFPHLEWRETNYLVLRRGPYVIAAGLDESTGGATNSLRGRFVNLFDSELRAQNQVALAPGSRFFLLDVEAAEKAGRVLLAAACKALPAQAGPDALSFLVEGLADTAGIMLLRSDRAPRAVTLAGRPLETFRYDAGQRLLWISFPNQPAPRQMSIQF
ncbi:MAG: hypothetical protein ABSH38_02445 [Verrucomicrobiota bacterium]|jgi:hypothetical protein